MRISLKKTTLFDVLHYVVRVSDVPTSSEVGTVFWIIGRSFGWNTFNLNTNQLEILTHCEMLTCCIMCAQILQGY